MDKTMQCPVRPPSGHTPRPDDTPRTKHLKELRLKRLAYYEKTGTDTPTSGNVRSGEIEGEELRTSMAKDPRVRESIHSPSASASSSKLLNHNPSTVEISVLNGVESNPSRGASVLSADGGKSKTKPAKNLTVYNEPKSANVVISSSGKRESNAKISATLDISNNLKNSRSARDHSAKRSFDSKVTKAISAPIRPSSGRTNKKSAKNGIKKPNENDLRDSVADQNLLAEGILLNALSVAGYQEAAGNRKSSEGVSDFFKRSHGSSAALGLSSSEDSSAVDAIPPSHIAIPKILEPQYEVDYSSLGLTSSANDEHQLCHGSLQQAAAASLLGCTDNGPVAEEGRQSTRILDSASGLKNILGQDKMNRLLKNLEESYWTLTDGESQSGTDHFNVESDMELHSVRSNENNDFFMRRQSEPVKMKGNESLVLQTHRPSLFDSFGNQPSQNGKDYLGNASDIIKKVRSTARVAFTSEEIYANADRNSNVGSNENKTGDVIDLNRSHGSVNSLVMDIERFENILKKEQQSSLGVRMTYKSMENLSVNKSNREVNGGHSPRFLPMDVPAHEAVTSRPRSVSVSNSSPRQQQKSKPEVDEVTTGGLDEHSPQYARRKRSQEHISGIKKHMNRVVDPELPEPLPPGEYRTPSIDRYFSSLQSLASNSKFSSENFEPIPEPDMGGPDKFNTVPSTSKSASNSGSAHKTTPRKADHGRDKFKTFETRLSLSGDQKSGTSLKVAADDDKEQQVTTNGRDDDDLTQVTSIVSGNTSLTERLKRFGIEKPFGNLAKPPDLLSDVTMDIERKQQEAMAAYKASNTRKMTAEEVFQSFVADSKDDNLSSSTDIELAGESDQTNWTPEVTPSPCDDDGRQGNRDNSPDPVKPSVDAMFGAPATNAKPPRIANNHDCGEKPPSEKKPDYKICPDCGVKNKAFLTWCKECGIVLEGEDPIKFNSGGSSRNSRRSSECGASLGSGALSKSMSTQVSKALTESMAVGDKSTSDQTVPKKVDVYFRGGQNEPVKNIASHSNVNPMVSSKSPLPSTSASLPSRMLDPAISEGVRDSIDGASHVRDSSNFEYDHQPNPSLVLPSSLQAELSLNLCDTRSNECNDNSGGKLQSEARRCSDNLVALSENIQFEYLKAESPTKQFSYELQEQLAINLGDSNTSSVLKSQMGKASGSEAQPSLIGRAQNLTSALPNPRQKNSFKSQPKPGPSFVTNAIPGPSTSNVNGSGRAAGSGGAAGGGDNSLELRGNVAAFHDMAVGPAGDHDDLVDEDLDVYDDIGDDDAEQAEQEKYQEFLQRLAKDPRFKSKSRASSRLYVPQPSESKGRPQSAGVHGTSRPQSAASKVKASLEAEPYQRRWARSSVAWDSFHMGEVRERSPVPNTSALHSSSVKLGIRPVSASPQKPAAVAKSGKGVAKTSKARPASAGPKVKSNSNVGKSLPETRYDDQDTSRSSKGFMVQQVTYSRGNTGKSLNKTALHTYAKYIAMSPRVEEGEFSVWLCLPDEIWLQIFSYLPHAALAQCAQVCQQLNRIAMDSSLWQRIVLRKRHCVSDDWLVQIGKRSPTSLNLIKCRGEKTTEQGLRELFRQCSETLQELNISGCSRGQLTGDSILLHAAARCRNISSLDCSWTNVNDNGVIAMAESCLRLESLSLNGCQGITDDAIHSVTTRHGLYLSSLECFGCFNLTSRGAFCIRNNCNSLTTLDLGQCWKLTDTSVSQLSASLRMVQKLDLRGIKQMNDACVLHVAQNCSRLQILSLANCGTLTDSVMVEIGNRLHRLQSLDLCGCKRITNQGIRALQNSRYLVYLDLSSTGITHKGVSTLANYCGDRIEVLKLNFCKNITLACLTKLAKNCRRLRKLFLYGVNGIRNVEEIRRENSNLIIEM